jgi:plastocyanin
MRRPLCTLLLCCALAVLAGCGSGGSSGTSSSGAGSASAGSASASATARTAGTQTGSLKVQTTPKFGAPPATAPVLSGVVQIAYRNIAVNPDTIKVRLGSTIRWTNYDSVEHNVTSAGGPQSFKSANFGEGASFEVKLTRPGTIHYLCTIHPASMNGTIQVVP